MKKFNMIILLLAGTIYNLFAQSGYNPKIRPGGDGPTKVMVRIYFLDIESINNIKQNYSADIVVRIDWKDERLIHKEGTYRMDEVWHPSLMISNVREFELRLPEVITVFENGTVHYLQRYYGTFASALDFQDFPFDEQILSLNLLSLRYSEQEVEFVLDSGGNEERFSITGWTVDPGDVSTEPMTVNFNRGESSGNLNITKARLTYTMVASRHISYYWYKVVAPMAIIIFLSWAVFYIDPIHVGAQIGVSATSILTLIAFLLRLENILPPISYLTTMDYFIFSALLIVFLAYMEAVMSTSFALNNKKEFALKLDFWSRLIFPTFFVIILLVFWVI